MKHFAVLSICVLLIGAAVVQAETITVSGVRTSYSETLDQLDVHLTGFGTGIPSGTLLGVLEGTWTALSADANPAGINLGNHIMGWEGLTTNNGYNGQTPPQSYVNFNSRMTTGVTWDRTLLSGSLYTTLSGNWYTTDAYGKLRVEPDPAYLPAYDQSLIARLFVSKDAGVMFAGSIGLSNRTQTYTDSFMVAPVPEPSVLVLLATGLIGLLAYAWRKRR